MVEHLSMGWGALFAAVGLWLLIGLLIARRSAKDLYFHIIDNYEVPPSFTQEVHYLAVVVAWPFALRLARSLRRRRKLISQAMNSLLDFVEQIDEEVGLPPEQKAHLERLRGILEELHD